MLIKKVVVDRADRLYQLPPDISSFIPGMRRRLKSNKVKILDLASFNWIDAFPSDKEITSESLKPASESDIEQLKTELAEWYNSYHGVNLEPTKEIYIGGSISNLMWQIALTFIDHSDIAFVPELGLPLYHRLVTACGGQALSYVISPKNHWLPDYDRITSPLGRIARLMFLNSPHNPTGAELNEKTITDLIWIASREHIAIIIDAAYATLSGRKPVSFMSVKGGKNVGIEVGSFSYTFGLPFLPLGFAVGNREIISGIKQTSKFFNIHIPKYYLEFITTAIRQFPSDSLKEIRKTINTNTSEANKLLSILELEKAGFDSIPFLWAKTKGRKQSTTTVRQLYRRALIQSIPGVAFGNSGEGYIRFSATASADTYILAQENAKKRLRILRRDDDDEGSD